MVKIPSAFSDRIRLQFGEEGEDLIHALDREPRTSVRLNARRGLQLFSDEEEVPWCETGKFLKDRPSFTLDPLFHAGCYYPQESSSMFLEWILKQCFGERRDLTCLDLCASPGGKSLVLSDFVGMEGRLISNEVIRTRNSILREVVTKWGASNVLVTCSDSSAFSSLNGYFDCVLVDAPCSGEGMFRKDMRAREEWSMDQVSHCSLRQWDILENILDTVAPGGYLIYSTCTFASEENEMNCRRVMESGLFERVQFDIPSHWNIRTIEEEGVFAMQFLPHRVQGEGFFISVFKRIDGTPGSSLKGKSIFTNPSKQDLEVIAKWYTGAGNIVQTAQHALYASAFSLNEINALAGSLYITMPGIELGSIMKNDLVPAQALANSMGIHPEVKTLEVELRDALSYLRGEQFSVTAESGWVIVKYDGRPLGWIKVINQRINNYYPKEWRIRMK